MNIVSQRLNDAAFWVEIAREESLGFGANDTAGMTQIREDALKKLPFLPSPSTSLEAYRYTDFEKYFDRNWEYFTQPEEMPVNVESFFSCEVYGLDTWLITMYNGWYTYKNAPLRILPNGTIVGSLARAMREAPEIVDAWLGKAATLNDYFSALNAALAADGFFIYVPDGVQLEKPIQMVNVVNHSSPLFMQTRHLIIVGKGSSVKLVHCDDSHNHTAGFTNSVTEVFMGKHAQVEYYKMQNINDESVIVNKTFINQQGSSSLKTYGICLHGGLIRNEIYNQLLEPHCEAHHYGLFLMDKKQQSDNIVSVIHAAPDCQSNQLYKGILDDYARGVFNGHIHVMRDAQRTAAYQSNRNILLTDKAVINTKPFLEIYADDVKCSHGATVGQLDANAMFYLRARGIDESNARLLLMYAFAAEVLENITIPTLHDRLDDLVKKRLRGELSICDQCVLHCKTPEKPIEFEIDMSKI